MNDWAQISIFSKLPNNFLNELDFSGFEFPENNIETLRLNLEQKLNHYVVTYKADICNLDTSLESHLCARIKGADLKPKELNLLNIYEAISKKQNVTFVVYQKPIEYINPYESAIASMYKKYNLLKTQKRDCHSDRSGGIRERQTDPSTTLRMTKHANVSSL